MPVTDFDDDFFDYEQFPYKQLSIADAENSKIKDSMELSCVAFIDVLGFSEMVDKNIDKVILALRYIKLFRDSYCRLPSKDYIGENNDLKNGLPEATMFSDSIVLSHCIDNDFNFYSFVVYIAELQMELLKKGILIRGGIEIGNLYHDDSFVFGDGLIAAYNLEKDRAVYPRILVGDKLFAEIEDQFNRNFELKLIYDGVPKHWREYENNNLEYISTDADGLKYINYIRYGLSDLDAHSVYKNGWKDKFDEAEQCYVDIVKPLIKFIKKGMNSTDERVQAKYIWLKNLYNRMLDVFVNRAHGGQSDKYKQRWAKRFID